jgi:putative ABC transport system permease protein
MMQNYLKVAWRNLMKSKVFSFINIFGLTIGLTSCVLIVIYLYHETHYDQFQVYADRLYQVDETFVSGGKEERWAGSPAPLAATLQQVFPQIEGTARLLPLSGDDKTIFQIGGNASNLKSYYEDKGALADSGFFKLFTYQFLAGDPHTVLSDPYSIVLSEDIARNIFGSPEAAMNKAIHVISNTQGEYDYKVSGVVSLPQGPSHIDSRFFLSMYGGYYGDWIKKNSNNLANNNMFATYILLKKGTDPASIEKQFPAFVDTYEGKDLKTSGFYKKQWLTKVTDIHLHANMTYGKDITPEGSVTYLYILASIALFVLVIACINFMNLATARSIKRSAEVGVRKSLGASRLSLVRQFMGEAMLMALLAAVGAAVLSYALFPGFVHLSGKNIQVSHAELIGLGGLLLLLALFTGLLAGSYPAFYLSSFQPVRILKGKLTNSLGAANLRKGLVVLQFMIAVILIVASVTIMDTMKYLRSADLGFAKDQQVILPLRGTSSQKAFTSLKAGLLRNPKVLSVTGAAYSPGIDNRSDEIMYGERQTSQEGRDVQINFTDFDYTRSLGIQPLAGRMFSSAFPSDSVDGIVVNEMALKAVGYTLQNGVGKVVHHNYPGRIAAYRIIGVVKDFHFDDLHVPINPMALMVDNDFGEFNYMIVHLAPGNPGPVLASMESTWKRLNPGSPFDYRFLDERFQQNYEADSRLNQIVGYFTLVAICISCLGLFGLAAFSAEQRTKEIGIRKVLGASALSIVRLLSGDFIKLVCISILIACPIAWWIMQKWLQDFAYAPPFKWTVFLYTTLAAIFIALITISFQSLKTAFASPVKSLRAE